jgi:hypothetical protein
MSSTDRAVVTSGSSIRTALPAPTEPVGGRRNPGPGCRVSWASTDVKYGKRRGRRRMFVDADGWIRPVGAGERRCLGSCDDNSHRRGHWFEPSIAHQCESRSEMVLEVTPEPFWSLGLVWKLNGEHSLPRQGRPPAKDAVCLSVGSRPLSPHRRIPLPSATTATYGPPSPCG